MNDAHTIERIRFADFNPEADLELLASWLALPDIAEWWPDTAHELEQARLRRGGGIQHRLILFEDRPVGYTRWQRVDLLALASTGLENIPEGAVVLDILIGEPELLGSGVGSAAVRLLCEMLFADASIPVVGTVTSTENHRAIRAFKKAGLRVLQEYKDERYGRCVVLARSRPQRAPRSRVAGRLDATAGTVAADDLRFESVTDGQTELLLDMMAAFNASEGIAWSRERVEPAVRRLLSSPDLGVVQWVVEAGEICGYFVVTWGFDLEWSGRDAFLTELFLQPQARGHGVGRRLMPRIEELAKHHGARALHLMVLPDNEAAVSLYRGAGYESPPRIFLSKALL